MVQFITPMPLPLLLLLSPLAAPTLAAMPAASAGRLSYSPRAPGLSAACAQDELVPLPYWVRSSGRCGDQQPDWTELMERSRHGRFRRRGKGDGGVLQQEAAQARLLVWEDSRKIERQLRRKRSIEPRREARYIRSLDQTRLCSSRAKCKDEMKQRVEAHSKAEFSTWSLMDMALDKGVFGFWFWTMVSERTCIAKKKSRSNVVAFLKFLHWAPVEIFIFTMSTFSVIQIGDVYVHSIYTER
ncbi:hypothetical protein EJB05_29344 [Eragrostis curvula]|uniref:Uncharacterized protein n=1 Tax=Eragrostis curvula TaxID=38414 RepID=A0A5J9UU28_9POAL|nr:hypothetical protein EJB05_29344 [Eragrostis curvula]